MFNSAQLRRALETVLQPKSVAQRAALRQQKRVLPYSIERE
jgi:hypothetical protein